jgi:transcription elongation factor GreA
LQNVRRQEVAERLQAALEVGDIDETAEHDGDKNEQAFVEGGRLTLRNMLKNAVIIDEKQAHHDEVTLGAVVTIVEGGNSPEEYYVVGAAEADPTQGKISNESPLGRALMGRRVGDSVQVSAPAGLLTFRIAAIK